MEDFFMFNVYIPLPYIIKCFIIIFLLNLQYLYLVQNINGKANKALKIAIEHKIPKLFFVINSKIKLH